MRHVIGIVIFLALVMNSSHNVDIYNSNYISKKTYEGRAKIMKLGFIEFLHC